MGEGLDHANAHSRRLRRRRLAHLAADLEGDIPWFYPLIEYEFRYYPYTYRQKLIRLITHPRPLESLLTLWALIELVASRKSGTA